MYFPNPVLLHLSRRDDIDGDPAAQNGRIIAWIIAVLVASVVVVGVWCLIKVWGSRARNQLAEEELGVAALPSPRRRVFGRAHRTTQPEESLPVYDPQRPPAFSPTGASLNMPPPAYLPGDANFQETFRRDGQSLGSIAEKDEIADEKEGSPKGQ